jgi:tyrosine-protein kinase Etk/Wzc
MNEPNSEQASAVGGQRVQQNGVIQSEFQGEYMPEENPIQILAIVNILLRRRWMIAGWTFALVVAVGLYSFFIAKSTYTATAKFIPSQRASISDRMSTVVGPGAIAASESFTESTSPEYYSALFNSRTFLEPILEQKFAVVELGQSVSLLEYLKIEGDSSQDRLLQGIEVVGKMVRIEAGKSKSLSAPPIISVTVVGSEPQLSADIANAFIKELNRYNKDTRSNKAKENRIFVMKQLTDSQAMLSKAENAVAMFNSRNRKISTPDLQSEKDRLLRTVKVQEEVFITLTKQLELAKIQEQEDQVSIEILENADPPISRTSPKRSQNVIIAGVFGIFLFGALALVLERFKNINRKDKNTAEFMDNLAGITREMTFGVFGRK